MWKKQSRWVLVVAIPAVATGFWLFQGPAIGSPSKPADAPVPVTTAVATTRALPIYLEGVGAIQAFRSVSIHPQVDGLLLQAAFTEGQQVHAGDLLGQIDPRSYQAALNQALAKKAEDEALLANARRDIQRSAPLVEKQFISTQVYDTQIAKAAQLEAAVKGDEAAIEATRIQLGYTAIRSPIEGRAGIRQIDPGNILHGSGPGGPSGGSGADTLVVITQLHPISVVFTLSQDELPHLVAAQALGPVTVAVFGRKGGEALDQGRLEVIDNQVDPTTGMVRIKATLPNGRDLLWPGQFVNAKLLVETHPQAVMVPATAVQRGNQGETVFVAKPDGTVESRKIITGALDGEQAEILQGVAAGETVVTAGHYRLRPGIKVTASLAASSTKLE
jgi:multidrug efflux system membrane fusion protein